MSNNCLDIENESAIQKFYHGKRIFITGITGFLGKAIIEKLLRVTQVEHFYLLVRSKKNKSINERIVELFKDPIFSNIKEKNINYLEKITVIRGDCSLPALGISQIDRDIIKNNVDIIIHGAATVRFEEELKLSIDINVNGTKELLNLAQDMKNLKVFVHVSTAFANCNHEHIKEEFYDCSITGEQAIALSNNINKNDLNFLTAKLLDDYPNTYVFTKCLAEDVVRSFRGKVSMVVFRPGIILPTYKEPIEGWIDNLYGPLGLGITVLGGICRVLPINEFVTAQIVPVDYCVNGLLTSACSSVLSKTESIPIYNYTPERINSINWRQFIQYGLDISEDLLIFKAMWYPTCKLVYQNWYFLFLSIFYHLILATIIDTALLITGKMPKLMQMYRRLYIVLPTLKYFMYSDFKMDNKNAMELLKRQEPADKKLFMFDLKNLDWQRLISVGATGLSVYLLKTDLSNKKKLRLHYNRLKILHYVTLSIIYSSITYALFKLTQLWLL